MSHAVNIKEKLARITAYWTPGVVAQINDYHLKLVKLKGEFVWHCHDDTDELFLVIAGDLTIHMRDRDVELTAGELFVVPRGVEHKPVASDECEVMLLEPASTLNTGDNPGELSVTDPAWL